MQTLIHSLVREHKLPKEVNGQLWSWAHVSPEPAAAGRRVATFLSGVSGLLLGVGVIFWVAANWQTMEKLHQLLLLQCLLAAAVMGALTLPKLRLAFLLLATLFLGGLLAFVGQTYQTGADPWQLFAAWAGLSLAWVLVSRSDALWTFWVLLAGGGIALWSGNDLLTGALDTNGNKLGIVTPFLWAMLVACLVFVAQGAAEASLSKLDLLRWLLLDAYKPSYALRLAIALALVAWCSYALLVVFDYFSYGRSADHPVWHMFFINTGLILLLGLWLKSRAWLDIAAFSLVLVAGNVIALSLVGRLLAATGVNSIGGAIWLLFLFGGVAIVLLGASGKWVMRLQAAQKLSDEEVL